MFVTNWKQGKIVAVEEPEAIEFSMYVYWKMYHLEKV